MPDVQGNESGDQGGKWQVKEFAFILLALALMGAFIYSLEKQASSRSPLSAPSTMLPPSSSSSPLLSASAAPKKPSLEERRREHEKKLRAALGFREDLVAMCRDGGNVAAWAGYEVICLKREAVSWRQPVTFPDYPVYEESEE